MAEATATKEKKERTPTARLHEAVATAHGIAWDGCHKAYVLMDEEQVAQMRSYGYGQDDDFLLRIPQDLPRREAARLVKAWWRESCSLRFVSAVRTVQGNPNEGFDTIVPQFGTW